MENSYIQFLESGTEKIILGIPFGKTRYKAENPLLIFHLNMAKMEVGTYSQIDEDESPYPYHYGFCRVCPKSGRWFYSTNEANQVYAAGNFYQWADMLYPSINKAAAPNQYNQANPCPNPIPPKSSAPSKFTKAVKQNINRPALVNNVV